MFAKKEFVLEEHIYAESISGWGRILLYILLAVFFGGLACVPSFFYQIVGEPSWLSLYMIQFVSVVLTLFSLVRVAELWRRIANREYVTTGTWLRLPDFTYVTMPRDGWLTLWLPNAATLADREIANGQIFYSDAEDVRDQATKAFSFEAEGILKLTFPPTEENKQKALDELGQALDIAFDEVLDFGDDKTVTSEDFPHLLARELEPNVRRWMADWDKISLSYGGKTYELFKLEAV